MDGGKKQIWGDSSCPSEYYSSNNYYSDQAVSHYNNSNNTTAPLTTSSFTNQLFGSINDPYNSISSSSSFAYNYNYGSGTDGDNVFGNIPSEPHHSSTRVAGRRCDAASSSKTREGKKSSNKKRSEAENKVINMGTSSSSDRFRPSLDSSMFEEKQGPPPCHLSSSLYYGCQDVYVTPPVSSTDGGGDDHDVDDSHYASRGNWWQGSLYY